MRKYRLERADLNQLRNRASKGSSVRRKAREQFDKDEDFLEFITSGDCTAFPRLLKIVEALEFQPVFVQNDEIFEALLERAPALLNCDDGQVRATYIRIVTLLCESDSRLVKILQNNVDVNILSILYATQMTERIEALHFFSKLFAITARSKFRSLLESWWRLQFIMRSALQCLIEIGLGNFRHSMLIEQPNSMNNDEIIAKKDQVNNSNEKLRLPALTILFEFALQSPHLLVELKINDGWFVQTMQRSFMEQSHPIHGIMMQILCNWLDSPILREQMELPLMLQQLFAPISEMIFFQGPKTELLSTHTIVDACMHSLLNILNNWTGVFALFATDSQASLHNSSCFRTFDHIGRNAFLTPNIEKVQCSIVDLISELLNLPYASKSFNSGSWDEAFHYYSKIQVPDSFNSSLREDFVLAETLFINSFQMFENDDLLKIYRNVLVYALINARLHKALIRLILQRPDDAVSLKATLLLADILRLSVNLPQNTRLEALSIAKVIRNTVRAFQSRTLRELAEMKGAGFEDKLPPQNIAVMADNNDAKVDWMSITSNNYSNAILLIGRLDQINDQINRPIILADFRLINTFMLTDVEYRRRRGNSILSRHSSASGDPNEDNNVLIEEAFPDTDSDLDGLLSKTFTSGANPSHIDKQGQTPSSSLFSITGVAVGMPILPMQSKHQHSSQEHVKPVWSAIWKVISTIDDYLSSQASQPKINISKIVDKCIPTFNQLVQFFLPSNQNFICSELEPLTMPCGQMSFHLLCTFSTSPSTIGADNAQWASDLISNFLYDFCSHLDPENLQSVFSSKYLLCTSSSNYFSILRALSSNPAGQKFFEQTAIAQILFDRASSDRTPMELVKLIASCLDYFPVNDPERFDNKQGNIFTRNILETVLTTAKDVAVRKWCTRFIDSFFTLHKLGLFSNFDWLWTMQLLFRQLSDPSPKIVRTALDLLLKWLPLTPEVSKNEVNEMLKLARLDTLGDSGTLLEIFLYDDVLLVDRDIRKMAEKSILKWKESFCLRYVDILEEQMRRALMQNNVNSGMFCYKRSMNGDFARASNQQLKRRKVSVLCPQHLYGHLAGSLLGQQLLRNHKIMENLEGTLLKFSSNKMEPDELSIKELKAALFGLAHILANSPQFQTNLKCKLSYYIGLIDACIKQSQSSMAWLSVRGYAIWAMNIAARRNPLVTSILSKIGYEFGEDSREILSNSLNVGNRSTQRGCMILPRNINTLFGNIFGEKSKLLATKQEDFHLPDIRNHNKWFCLHYNKKKNRDSDNECSFDATDRALIIEQVCQLLNQPSNAETLFKLLRFYKDNPAAFENPCVFSDVLQIFDSKSIGFEARRLICQLFWSAIQ